MIPQTPTVTEQVNSAFLIFLVACITLLVLISFLMVFFVVKYHWKRHGTPQSGEGNVLLEVAWTVIPTILVLGMFYFGWIGYRSMKNIPGETIKVQVTGRMWSWLFRYENGVQSDVLKVPVGKNVEMRIFSSDVLHSFYIPAFRVKQDAVPGMENVLWFTPTDTGRFDIFCAEYCGDRHSYMYANLVVMPEDSFRTWLIEEGKAVQKEAEAVERGELKPEDLARRGERLAKTKGCIACHSLDGTERVGPTFKGLFGRRTTVIENGQEVELEADEEYVERAITRPNSEIVKGYKPLMPSQEGKMDEDELKALIEYLKTLR